ncbi:hypothetical protein [uncultured Dokdonia sp.]|uniref:hypothetical protein n=1 Tax=uncultured Dokdonia sp. TaxID=575653 RepID=UPI00262C0239|nr:hypothetical protein [uncultured Dokdonia sp.]
MKKSCIYIASLLIIISSLYSCGNDDDNIITPPPTVSETVDVEAIIERLTNGNSKTWKIREGFVIVNNETSVDFMDEYNVQDDEFRFTLENGNVSLVWKKGFRMNIGVNTFEEFFSDTNEASITYQVTINPDTGVLSLGQSGITLQLAENVDVGIINLIQPGGQTDLSVNLVPKSAADYIQIPTTLSNPQELFSFSTGVPRVGFKVSQSQNSLYLTNRNDLEGFGAQQAFKYDLSNNILTSIDFSLQDFATKNIEFIEGEVLSLGGARFQTLDYELTGVQSFIEIDPFTTLIFNGTAALDDTVYTFGNSNSSDLISTWRIGDAGTQVLATIPAPSDIAFMDGEIIDQVLYIFGGWDTDFIGSDILYTYHIDTGAQNQIQLPVVIQQAYTSTVENLIYVLGVQPFNNSQNQHKVFGVYNTLDGSFQEINIDSLNPILSNKNIEQLQVTGNKAYFVTSEALEAPNGYINNVYEATLN